MYENIPSVNLARPVRDRNAVRSGPSHRPSAGAGGPLDGRGRTNPEETPKDPRSWLCKDRVIQALLAWGPAALWAGVLFLLSEAQLDPGPGWLALNDKVVHLGLYGVLGATLAWGLRRGASSLRPLPLILLGVAYGVLDEWHQSFVPGRDPSTGDVLADAAGLILGFALMHLLPWPGLRERPDPST